MLRKRIPTDIVAGVLADFLRIGLPTRSAGETALIRLIKTFPPGTRSQEEIDAEIEEGRNHSR